MLIKTLQAHDRKIKLSIIKHNNSLKIKSHKKNLIEGQKSKAGKKIYLHALKKL